MKEFEILRNFNVNVIRRSRNEYEVKNNVWLRFTQSTHDAGGDLLSLTIRPYTLTVEDIRTAEVKQTIPSPFTVARSLVGFYNSVSFNNLGL